MKYAAVSALILLAACTATTGDRYDMYSLQDSAASIRELESDSPARPAGFVSLMEQQPDGKWIVRDDAALVP